MNAIVEILVDHFLFQAVQVCAYKLGINVNKVSVKPSNNLTAPNASPTGASLTSEAVCWVSPKVVK